MSHIEQQITDDSLPILSAESKARIWATLAAQHAAKRNTRRSVRSGKRLVTTIMIVALLIMGVRGGFSASYTFAQEMLAKVGHRIDVDDTSSAIPTPVPMGSTQTALSVSLAEVQAQAPFRLMQPSYLPEGYSLNETQLITSDIEGTIVELIYRGQGSIRLSQSKPTQQIIMKANESRIIKIVDIYGAEAIFYDRGGPIFSEILVWTDGIYWYELTGTASLEELVKIAESLR